jgi:hypothetical protein
VYIGPAPRAGRSRFFSLLAPLVQKTLALARYGACALGRQS